MNSIHQASRRQGLVRTRDRRILGGVCSGLARRFGTGVWTMRLIFAITLIVIPGSQLLVYPLLWVLMPLEQNAAYVAGETLPPR